jgi:hypothetical protein
MITDGIEAQMAATDTTMGWRVAVLLPCVMTIDG